MPSIQTASELVGRLQPRSHSWDNLPSSKDHITAQDIAGAIGMIKLEPERLLLRVLYAEQHSYRPKLVKAISKRTASNPILVNLAIDEVSWQSICLDCNGQKIKTDTRGQNTMCLTCKGTGYKPMPNHARAKRLGLHHEQMKRKYLTAYETVLDFVRLCDMRAKRALALNLA